MSQCRSTWSGSSCEPVLDCKEAGAAGFADVVRARVHLSGLADFACRNAVRAVHGEIPGNTRPIPCHWLCAG